MFFSSFFLEASFFPKRKFFLLDFKFFFQVFFFVSFFLKNEAREGNGLTEVISLLKFGDCYYATNVQFGVNTR